MSQSQPPDEQVTPPPIAAPARPPSPTHSDARATYNMVSDIGIGVNVRWKDNLFQGLFILGSLLVGVIVGYFVVDDDDRLAGIMGGAIVGLMAGLLISGLFIMIYRGLRHLNGKHD